ncbi:MAG TPA: hypothetical protein VK586_04975, partial [Streptosporangiaceae bacterium]|nr:hypothetical protein [Streptosporangiaceae bacterium]
MNRTGTGRDAGPESGGGQDDAARPAVLAVAAGRAGCPGGGGGPGGLSSGWRRAGRAVLGPAAGTPRLPGAGQEAEPAQVTAAG